MLTINNLTKRFGDNTLFKNVTLTFEQGKIIAVIGKNGAGKTTFFNTITKTDNNFEGQLLYHKKPYQKINDLGYVPAELYFYPKITGMEYLNYFLFSRNLTNNGKIEHWNQLFQLPLQSFVDSYSTGMKKKLALLGVLIQNNNIFIFDEPYNGLDIESCLLLDKIILKLKENNKLVIISSHILSSLYEISDQILLIQDQKIEAFTDKKEFKQLNNLLIDKDIELTIDGMIN
ncbi:MAG: ABC transporter ATP-binding protein [Flavobacteriales bacterium]|jgi:ABC-2 type transport system ATP-binding protein|nr:ABC transporter ATP-binding protein [Flavobacteriales bacterium]